MYASHFAPAIFRRQQALKLYSCWKLLRLLRQAASSTPSGAAWIGELGMCEYALTEPLFGSTW